jgi:hypothetical protein
MKHAATDKDPSLLNLLTKGTVNGIENNLEHANIVACP